MSRRKPKKNYIIPITDLISFSSYIRLSNLIVIELYSTIYGNCENILPTISNIMNSKEEDIKWLSLNINKLLEDEAKKRNIPANTIDPYTITISPKSPLFVIRKYITFNSPKPLFLFMKNSNIIGELFEANPPLLSTLVSYFVQPDIHSMADIPENITNSVPVYQIEDQEAMEFTIPSSIPVDSTAVELKDTSRPVSSLKNDNKVDSDIKPTVIFVLGGPGSGKGTQSTKLVNEFGIVHLSAGDLLRDERATGSEDAQLIEEYIKDGKIVPVVITVNLIKKAMLSNIENGKTFFLIDGFPRNAENLTGWNEVMDGFATVSLLLHFECPEEVLEARLLKRGLTSGRTDDNIESIRKRFKTFIESTCPIIDDFREQGLVKTIQADRDIEVVFAETREVVEKVLNA